MPRTRPTLLAALALPPCGGGSGRVLHVATRR